MPPKSITQLIEDIEIAVRDASFSAVWDMKDLAYVLMQLVDLDPDEQWKIRTRLKCLIP